MFKKYIAGLLGCFAFGSVAAQQLPIMNHYIYNPYLFNPARTGQNEYGSVNVNFKKQWVALPYSPLTAVLSLESPLRNTKIGNMGLGGMVYSDQMHIVNKVGGLASYAYHIPFEKNKDYKHQLSAGLSLGVIHQRFDYNSATVGNEADVQFLAENATGTSFDFSAGIDYQWRDLHVGFSMLQGLNNGLKFITPGVDDIRFVNTRHFMMMASYRHRFNPETKKHPFFLEPVFMGRMLKAVPFQAEANLLFGMEGIAWLGLGYRSSNIETATAAMNVTVGGEVLRKFVFAYSFEIGVDGQLNASMGTQHEFMLSYRFGVEGGSKKIKQMEEQIRQLEMKDSLLEKRLQVTESTVSRQQAVLDSLRNELATQSGNQAQLKQQIAEQEQKLKTMQEAQAKQNQRLDNHDKDIDELRKAIQQNPLQYKKIGEVFFDSGSSTLDKTAGANLDAVKSYLASKPDSKIYLYGHASTDGNAKANQELSVKRAAAVRQQLVSMGIDASRIEMLPFGAEMPASGDASKSGSVDRRVDIIVTEGKGKL